MKRSEFFQKFNSLMETQGVLLIEYYGFLRLNYRCVDIGMLFDREKIKDIEVEDSFKEYIRIIPDGKHNMLNMTFGRKKLQFRLVYDDYDSRYCIHDIIYSALLEMGFVRLYIKTMKNILDVDKPTSVLQETLDHIMKYDLSVAMYNALNTDFEEICKERKYIYDYLCNEPYWDIDGKKRYGHEQSMFTLLIYKHDVMRFINDYPNSVGCIQVLLNWWKTWKFNCDKYNEEEIGL